MASSFIDFKGVFGFWAHDSVVEIMQYFIIDEIHKDSLSENWLVEFKLELALQSMPIVSGGMSLELDHFIINTERRDCLLRIISKIENKFKRDYFLLTNSDVFELRKMAMSILDKSGKVDFESKIQIEEIIKSSYWSETDETLNLEKYLIGFQLLVKLLKNELTSTASSTINYW